MSSKTKNLNSVLYEDIICFSVKSNILWISRWRPIWSRSTKYLKVFTLGIIYCLIFAVGSLMFAFGKDYMTFFIGMGIFGTGMAGYVGFKQVMTTEIFGVEGLPNFIIIDQLITWPASVIVPNLLIYLSSISNDFGLIFKVSAGAAIIWYVQSCPCKRINY